jgi:hypothetical protein
MARTYNKRVIIIDRVCVRGWEEWIDEDVIQKKYRVDRTVSDGLNEALNKMISPVNRRTMSSNCTQIQTHTVVVQAHISLVEVGHSSLRTHAQGFGSALGLKCNAASRNSGIDQIQHGVT